LNIATSEGIGLAELETLPGTGNEGRVTKKDILEYVAKRKQQGPLTPSLTPQVATVMSTNVGSTELTIPLSKIEPSSASSLPVTYAGNVEIVEMDRMRKLIADHMVRSKQTSPHVTSFTEADVTNLVLWRERVKKEFEKREATKITFTPLFIEAIVRCIKKFPLINCSIDGTNIIIKKDINIGMATALPSGNLIVPVIKNADQYNMVGLAKQVNQLADAARNGKLKVDDTQGGTFTLTNVGTFGSLMGTPIINQPQVAILAVGAIKKRPVVVETPAGDSIAIRHMMYLSMSYDHRIVDGSLGATFLTAVAKELESFDPDRQL
jgi:2-oxoglutarate dehydrogenase E2 component (dihydrolipoamide succinyltransferase)